MSPEVSILVGNASKGIPIILACIGAGMTVAMLRRYSDRHTRRQGLLRPGFVWSVALGLLFIDFAVAHGMAANLGNPFNWRIIYSAIGMLLQVYALALVLQADERGELNPAPINDEVDVISMLVDRSIERDKTLKLTIMSALGIMALVLTFLIYFSIVNFDRLYEIMRDNNDLLRTMQ